MVVYNGTVVVARSEDDSTVETSDVLVSLGKDGRDSVAEMDTDSLVSATKVLVDVVAVVGLAGETVLVPTVRVNDAVCVMGQEVLRVSSNEDSEVNVDVVVSIIPIEDNVVDKDWGELRSGITGEDWDHDIDWSEPAVVEIENTDEENISELCCNVVDVIIEAESLEVVIEPLRQSVVIVVHGANEVLND